MDFWICASPAVISVDTHSIYAIFINIHALTATVSLISGLVIITSQKYFVNRRLFSVYLWTLVGMTIFLTGAMLTQWAVYASTEQIAFSGLFVLALYMLYRAFRAQTLIEARQNDWRHEYIHHIGFTLISLFEGFIIVALINLETTGWIIAIVAILGVLVGRRAIDMAETRQYTDTAHA